MNSYKTKAVVNNGEAAMSQSLAEPVASPCVSICALDENDICVGCQRSGAEITVWSTSSEEQKAAIMEKVREREKASYI